MDDGTRRVLSQIAITIAQAQRSRSLSTAALAKLSTIDRAELDLILAGESDLSLQTIYLLAGALGIRPAQLLEGIEWIPDGSGGGKFRVEDACGD